MSFTFRLLIVIIAIVLGIYFCIADPVNNPEGFENEEKETVKLSTDEKCPNLLVQEDGGITLTNTKEKIVPGVNPMRFNNLEEYVQFIEWQRSNGVKCPVLFLQKTENAQGEVSYTARPNIADPQGGLSIANMSLDELRQRCESNVPMSSGLSGLEDVNDATYFRTGCGSVTGEIALKTGPVTTGIVDATRNDVPYNTNSMPSFDPSSFYQGTITPMDEMLTRQRNLPESPSAMDSNWGGKEYTRSLIKKGLYDGNKRSLIEKDPFA
jgi:hypothetical protein